MLYEIYLQITLPELEFAGIFTLYVNLASLPFLRLTTLAPVLSAYREWLRVLKKGGCFLNFDSNFLFSLYDEELKRQHEINEKEAVKMGYVPTPNDHLADGRMSVPRWKKARGGRSIPGGPSTPPPWSRGGSEPLPGAGLVHSARR